MENTAFERNKPNLGELIGDKAVLPKQILENKFLYHCLLLFQYIRK